MARGQRTYAYQSSPDVGPYGTATNRAGSGGYGFDPGPAIGSLFNSGFIPSVNPSIPSYSAPSAPEPAVSQSSLETCMLSGMSREACEQREAIAAELARQANTQQNQGSGPGNDGYADSVTPGPDTTAPVTAPEAVPQAVPDTPAPPPQNTPQAPPPTQAPPLAFNPDNLNVPNPPVAEDINVDPDLGPAPAVAPPTGRDFGPRGDPNNPTPATDEDIGQTVSPSQAIGPNSSISMTNVGPNGKGFAPSAQQNTPANTSFAPVTTQAKDYTDPVFGKNMPQQIDVDKMLEDIQTPNIDPFAPLSMPYDTPTPNTPMGKSQAQVGPTQTTKGLTEQQKADLNDPVNAPLASPPQAPAPPAPPAPPAVTDAEKADMAFGDNLAAALAGINADQNAIGAPSPSLGAPSTSATPSGPGMVGQQGFFSGVDFAAPAPPGMTFGPMSPAVTSSPPMSAISVAGILAGLYGTPEAPPAMSADDEAAAAMAGIAGLSDTGYGPTGDATNADGTIGGISVGDTSGDAGVSLGGGQGIGPGPDGGTAVGFGGTAEGPGAPGGPAGTGDTGGHSIGGNVAGGDNSGNTGVSFGGTPGDSTTGDGTTGDGTTGTSPGDGVGNTGDSAGMW